MAEEASSKRKGIDITAAMNILAQRQEQNNNPALHSQQYASNNGCPCGQLHPEGRGTNNNSETGGQVIDLFHQDSTTTTSTSNKQLQDNNPSDPAKEEKQQEPKEDQNNLLVKEIETMSLKQRIHAVLRAQEDRVATYRRFDEGLRDVLRTGNFTMYPALCVQVTATFAVLSNTINAVRDANTGNTTKQLQQFLTQLQQNERDKLNYTAALHLEQIRQAGGGAEDDDGGSATTQNLFQTSIRSLRQQIATCVETINEILEELQCLLLEEEEEGA
jgi:hypothetical protein